MLPNAILVLVEFGFSPKKWRRPECMTIQLFKDPDTNNILITAQETTYTSNEYVIYSGLFEKNLKRSIVKTISMINFRNNFIGNSMLDGEPIIVVIKKINTKKNRLIPHAPTGVLYCRISCFTAKKKTVKTVIPCTRELDTVSSSSAICGLNGFQIPNAKAIENKPKTIIFNSLFFSIILQFILCLKKGIFTKYY